MQYLFTNNFIKSGKYIFLAQKYSKLDIEQYKNYNFLHDIIV